MELLSSLYVMKCNILFKSSLGGGLDLILGSLHYSALSFEYRSAKRIKPYRLTKFFTIWKVCSFFFMVFFHWKKGAGVDWQFLLYDEVSRPRIVFFFCESHSVSSIFYYLSRCRTMNFMLLYFLIHVL